MKSQQGLSLTELIIAVAISVIAAIFLASVLVNQNSLFGDQQAKVDHGLSLNESTVLISKFIKESLAVSSSYPSQNPTYFSGNDTLILRLPSIDQSQSIIPATYDYLVIFKDSSNPTILRAKLFKDNLSYRQTLDDVLTTNLENINFTYFNDLKQTVSPDQATLINFVINLQTKAAGFDVESSASGQSSLRNN